MSTTDPKTNFKMVACIDPVDITTAGTTDGASIDTKGFRWATFIIQVGTAAGAVFTGLAAIITSDPATGGAFATAITGAVFEPVDLLAGDTEQIGRIDLHKLDYSTSRWLRVEVTHVGATITASPISCVVVLSNSEDDTKYQTQAFAFGV